MRGAARGALLTHRLLAFSRRQPLEPKSVSVNNLITGMSECCAGRSARAIAIETVLAGGVWPIFVDANQLESALLNLAVNARDAMPDGGKLTIEAANVYLDEDYAAAAEVSPGQYVGIFVSDTGVGMTPEVAAKAFDPFFTTKEVGQGTGLGLSQVYGFVKQSGGHVKIYSEVGAGTTVKLYLPRLLSADSAPTMQPAAPTVRSAREGRDHSGGRGRSGRAQFHRRDAARTGLPRARCRRMARTGSAAARRASRNRAAVHRCRFAGRHERPATGRRGAAATGRAEGAVHQRLRAQRHRSPRRLDPGVELIVKPFTYATLAAKFVGFSIVPEAAPERYPHRTKSHRLSANHPGRARVGRNIGVAVGDDLRDHQCRGAPRRVERLGGAGDDAVDPGRRAALLSARCCSPAIPASSRSLPLGSVIAFSVTGVTHFIIGRYANYRAIGAIGTNLAGPVMQFNLVVSLALAILFLGETLTLLRIVGILLIVAGPAAVSGEGKRAAPAAPAKFTPRMAEGYLFAASPRAAMA